MPNEKIKDLRRQIDLLDKRILELLLQRAECSKVIGKLKIASLNEKESLERDSAREKEIFANVDENFKVLSPSMYHSKNVELVKEIFEKIIRFGFSQQ
jgi:chorismate mutase